MAEHPPIILENPTQLVESTKFAPPPLKTNITKTEVSVQAARRDFAVRRNRRTGGLTVKCVRANFT